MHSPGLTAHLAILDVGLDRSATRIQTNGHAFSTVGTGDLGLGVPGVVLRAVAGGKIIHIAVGAPVKAFS